MPSRDQQPNGEYLYEEHPAREGSPEAEAARLLDNVLDLTEQTDSSKVDKRLRQLATVVQGLEESTVTQSGLVHVVTEALREYAKEAQLSEQTWNNLSVQVANVLFDDSAARERLDRLW